VGSLADQLLSERSYPIDVIAVPPKVHPHVAAIDPTQIRNRSSERGNVSLPHGIVFVAPHQHADAAHSVRLLRARRKRPRDCRATKEGDELAPSHSITSSARSRKASGIVRPIALAVVRLTTSSNFVGCSTGISAGFVPRRILSTCSAVRRNRSGMLGP